MFMTYQFLSHYLPGFCRPFELLGWFLIRRIDDVVDCWDDAAPRLEGEIGGWESELSEVVSLVQNGYCAWTTRRMY